MIVTGKSKILSRVCRRAAVPCRLAVVSLAALLALGAAQAVAEVIPIEKISHIHDLSVDPDNPERLYLATHHGMFLAGPDGKAAPVGSAKDDFMSFAADPANPDIFYASGHPPGGGNLGLMMSPDRGVSWKAVSPGVGGPVDFHAMAVSPADPKVIYGIYGELQVSRDGGASWSKVGPVPQKTFALSGSTLDSQTVYAAGVNGLFVSRNGGQSWDPALMQQRPTTVVEVSPSGRLFAFVYGVGLVQRDESASRWSVQSSDFGKRYIVKLAFDPRDP
ncbi:MAG TPA: hypothetical protein VLA28_11515, partial [Afifellaceae bacterium]|nr:hypothetical protein [Afifellaceae bacterium]